MTFALLIEGGDLAVALARWPAEGFLEPSIEGAYHYFIRQYLLPKIPLPSSYLSQETSVPRDVATGSRQVPWAVTKRYYQKYSTTRRKIIFLAYNRQRELNHTQRELVGPSESPLKAYWL